MKNNNLILEEFEERTVTDGNENKYGQENIPYILIGYCYMDREIVLPLVQYLDAKNGGRFHIRYDLTINPLMEMNMGKVREIRDAHAILIFVSENFKDSSYFMNFMNCTKHYNKTVVIAYLNYADKIPETLELPLKSYHYMRFDNKEEFSDELSKLVELKECRAGALASDFPVDLMHRYRSLVPLRSHFLMLVQNEDDGIINNRFENYSDFYFDDRFRKKTIMVFRYYLERQSTLEKIYITNNAFKIGRKEEICDYVVDNNLAVSRLHAIFYITDNGCLIEDNNSSNKSYINEKLLQKGERVLLHAGDVVDLGREIFTFGVEEVEMEGII